MGGEESAELKVATVQENEDNIPHNNKDNSSLLDMDGDDVPAYGIINHDNNSDLPKNKDKDITNLVFLRTQLCGATSKYEARVVEITLSDFQSLCQNFHWNSWEIDGELYG